MNKCWLRIFVMTTPNNTNLIVYLLEFIGIKKDYLQLNFLNDEKMNDY